MHYGKLSKIYKKNPTFLHPLDRRGPVDVSHLVDEEELRIGRKEVTSNRKEVTSKSRSHQTLVKAEVEKRNRTTSESSKSSSDERHGKVSQINFVICCEHRGLWIGSKIKPFSRKEPEISVQ